MDALIKFAAQAAIDSIEFPETGTPSLEWNEGLWQSFRDEFPNFTDEDLTFVSKIFEATVRAYCKRNYIEL